MRKYVYSTLGIMIFGVALASDVPPVSPQEFGSDLILSTPWWSWFAGGDGFWGTLLLGVLGIVYKVARPVILDWVESKKLSKLFLTIETGVIGFKALLTDKYKELGGGKLTEEQASEIKAACRNYIIQFAATQGIDVIKEYGDNIINILIEWMLAKVKSEAANSVATTVVANLGKVLTPPLPELAP